MIFHCPHCSAKVTTTTGSCSNCKKRMTHKCPHCAEEIAVNAQVCKYCGEGTGSSVPALRPEPGIEYVESAPKKRCCRGFLTVMILLAGFVAAGVFVRTDCMACAKSPAHSVTTIASSAACNGQSHCGRKICKGHKTPLWITVLEKTTGKTCCTTKAAPPAPQPEKKAELY